MIMNNENKKLSRNRKRRIGRKIRMSSGEKLIINKNKTEEKIKIKNIDKIKQLETLLVHNKDADNPNDVQNTLKDLNKFMLLIKTYMRLNKKV